MGNPKDASMKPPGGIYLPFGGASLSPAFHNLDSIQEQDMK